MYEMARCNSASFLKTQSFQTLPKEKLLYYSLYKTVKGMSFPGTPWRCVKSSCWNSTQVQSTQAYRWFIACDNIDISLLRSLQYSFFSFSLVFSMMWYPHSPPVPLFYICFIPLLFYGYNLSCHCPFAQLYVSNGTYSLSLFLQSWTSKKISFFIPSSFSLPRLLFLRLVFFILSVSRMCPVTGLVRDFTILT